jgi:hypothetical protein
VPLDPRSFVSTKPKRQCEIACNLQSPTPGEAFETIIAVIFVTI